MHYFTKKQKQNIPIMEIKKKESHRDILDLIADENVLHKTD